MCYNLIWVYKYCDGELHLEVPKNCINMELDKAEGSIKWTKKILGKDYPCFIYDPSEFSIFNDDSSINVDSVLNLVVKFGGKFNDPVHD